MAETDRGGEGFVQVGIMVAIAGLVIPSLMVAFGALEKGAAIRYLALTYAVGSALVVIGILLEEYPPPESDSVPDDPTEILEGRDGGH